VEGCFTDKSRCLYMPSGGFCEKILTQEFWSFILRAEWSNGRRRRKEKSFLLFAVWVDGREEVGEV